MTLTDLFTDLEVLSMIKEHDKLCLRDGHITIEQKSNPIKTAIRRWFHNDSRRIMIMEVNNIINSSLECYNKSLKDTEHEWIINQFIKHFTNVIDGLNKLKKTYFNDSSIVARLNVIIDILSQEITKQKDYSQ